MMRNVNFKPITDFYYVQTNTLKLKMQTTWSKKGFAEKEK